MVSLSFAFPFEGFLLRLVLLLFILPSIQSPHPASPVSAKEPYARNQWEASSHTPVRQSNR